ncbi:MAG: DNA mismatch repair protein MutS [Lachnospiraceae bacterium]|nr:DNA mismatch repair protein MutS [Lachnospiraceae bacterium]
MMEHYLQTKEEYSDCILFYRLGDFYEMFFDDAKTVSAELELTLTGKSCGLDERAPMCGVPFHAADSYLSKLVSRGYKVAICEQVEDPKEAKGMVKREVIRIVSPGTNLNMQSLEASENNYLCCIYYTPDRIGLSFADITTGEFLVTETEDLRQCFDELQKFSPTEVICNEAFTMSGADLTFIREKIGAVIFTQDAHAFDETEGERALTGHFHVSSLQALGITEFPCGTVAAGALLSYLRRMQKQEPDNITKLTPYLASRYMLLDLATRRNLELVETLREKKRRGSLLWVLDKTKTAMGARRLHAFVEQPLIDAAAIQSRLDAVDMLVKYPIVREELREYLTPVYDLERLMSRISFHTANPRDLLAFSTSIGMLPAIKTALADVEESDTTASLLALAEAVDPLTDLHELISSSIVEEPPLSVRDGGFIKDGVDEEIDRCRKAMTDGNRWLLELEESERARTGIKSLKIKYSNVFGYAFEVTNLFKDKVPEDYVRRQTLTNAERYITPKLKELEDTILHAQERVNTLEYACFTRIRDRLAAEIARVQKTTDALSLLDAYASLAHVAEKNHYVKPEIRTDGLIKVKNARHPVVEQMLSGSELFIANDIHLDEKKHSVAVITGPNMAGKSTYMRQAALIVLMAQIGSFVPADSAQIGIADRIFTRVGASDDLASGQSTFMVEMSEMANILRNATKHSLIILDEIGRGTSTYDGLSIAWAVVEYISNRRILGAKTLFATHYHELTELEGKIDNVNNYCIAVRENGDDIVFLRKIVRGGADKSYGIQVARLAGVPDMVIDRAKLILAELVGSDITERVRSIEVNTAKGTEQKAVKPMDDVDRNQLSFFNTVSDADIIKELKEIEVDRLTPFDALNTLYRWQSMLKNRYIAGKDGQDAENDT